MGRELLALLSLSWACEARPEVDVGSGPQPQASTPAPEASIETVIVGGGEFELKAELLLPASPGPSPAIVWNHGSEKEPSLKWLGDTARWFQNHGFVVLVVYRRGASGSAGPHWSARVDEATANGVGRDAAIVDALSDDLRDVRTAGAWLAEQERVDPDRVVVAGCSFGGVLAVLASEHETPFRAAVDFAGASMMWQTHAAVRQRLLDAVRGSKIPVFFLQAANDFDTAPTTVLSAEMAGLGKPHRGRVFAAFGSTPMAGHAGFCNRAQSVWGADVLEFLAEHVGPG